MGLSTGERHTKIIWSVNNINTLLPRLVNKEGDYFGEEINPYLELKRICDQLWPTLLSKKANGGFWLLGSDMSVESNKCTIWSTALYNNIKYCEKPMSEEYLRKKEEREAKRDAECIFDIQSYFEIERNLSDRNGAVFSIYGWLQNIQYAANRYEDETAKMYVDLMFVVSSAMGEIFRIFHKEKEFSELWLLREIAAILIGPTYYKKKSEVDVVTMLCAKECMHHDILSWNKGYYYRINELRQILKSLTDDNSLKNRFLILMKMGGRRFDNKKKLAEARIIAKQLKVSYATLDSIVKGDVELHKSNSSEEYALDRGMYREDLLND